MVAPARSGRYLVAAVALAGLVCALESNSEDTYGVKRTARLAEVPELTCVRNVVEHVAEGRGYDEWRWPESDGARDEVGYAHHFAYNGDRVRVQLGLFRDSPGVVRLIQSYAKIDEAPDEREVAESRRLMAAVEKGLMSQCGVRDLVGRVRESCSGVECE